MSPLFRVPSCVRTTYPVQSDTHTLLPCNPLNLLIGETRCSIVCLITATNVARQSPLLPQSLKPFTDAGRHRPTTSARKTANNTLHWQKCGNSMATTPKHRRTIMRYVLLIVLALFAFSVKANELPPLPEGGLDFFLEGVCIDDESGQEGYCYMGKSKDGVTYLTFWQDDKMMLIREVTGDTYKTIWTSDHFNSI